MVPDGSHRGALMEDIRDGSGIRGDRLTHAIFPDFDKFCVYTVTRRLFSVAGSWRSEAAGNDIFFTNAGEASGFHHDALEGVSDKAVPKNTIDPPDFMKVKATNGFRVI